MKLKSATGTNESKRQKGEQAVLRSHPPDLNPTEKMWGCTGSDSPIVDLNGGDSHY